MPEEKGISSFTAAIEKELSDIQEILIHTKSYLLITKAIYRFFWQEYGYVKGWLAIPRRRIRLSVG